ncbi:hypothetical protein N665_0385s0039 [Sinapis alba]|nr:hypothetical protein N665_0385s0037 [Sinapis alba]KAF8093292.1 hypothetical protein N665_0385s0039 [Sinapis alba]
MPSSFNTTDLFLRRKTNLHTPRFKFVACLGMEGSHGSRACCQRVD